MTSDQKFTLLISSIGLIFAVMVATLGFIIKISMGWSRMETTLTGLSIQNANEHKALAEAATADRVATNERLTWLERMNPRRRSLPVCRPFVIDSLPTGWPRPVDLSHDNHRKPHHKRRPRSFHDSHLWPR